MSDQPKAKIFRDEYTQSPDGSWFRTQEAGVPKPKKPGFWSKLGQSIGEAIGQAKFGS